MTGPEHYREAERLLTEHEYASADALAAAQVHATLALATATLAAAEHTGQATYDAANGVRTRLLVIRPHRGDDVDPPYPGSEWGRAIYGGAA